jgi:hypothetical protein
MGQGLHTKQMTPVDPMTAAAGDRAKDGCEYDGLEANTGDGRSCKPKAGESPEASMFQTLFGGKKPA